MGFFRKKKKNDEICLSDGIVMQQPLEMETSSWLKNCMFKSLLVFSVVFGAIGCFLSSFELEYYMIPTALILFCMALLFTTIYYRGWIMDVVYIIFLTIFIFLVRGLQVYINSGYYLVINRIFETVENYFDLPGMQYYEIQADNEVLAVSVIVAFIGTVMMIVANVIISRTMNVWFLVALTGFLWILPMYFRLEADAFYVILMVTGYLAVWSIRSSGSYGMDRKHRDYKWKDKRGKRLQIWYVQDAATMLGTMGVFLLFTILIYGLTSVVSDKDTFNIRYNQNPYKEESEEAIQEFSTRGFSFFNRYDAVGGISEGQLGGVASVSPDYQTDLIVTFTPYSYEPVYLKAYTGIDYISSESKWITFERQADNPYYKKMLEEMEDPAEDQGYSFGYPVEAENLAQNVFSLEDGTDDYKRFIGNGIIQIENVGANTSYAYVPYYVPDENVPHSADNEQLDYGAFDIVNKLTEVSSKNKPVQYEYWALEDREFMEKYGDSFHTEALDTLTQQAENNYLTVPPECYDAVAQASAEAGIEEGDTQEEIVQKVKDYFTNEFLYTTRPGRTPRDVDFVTHFLERKRGYCAHFATAATLIYRYNGIPARYIEGYVITYEDIMNADLRDDLEYSDFFEEASANQFGRSAVVEVEVTDARAHAWVEVFDPDFGWLQEEVTTAAIDPEEDLETFWDVFGDGNNAQDEMSDNVFDLETLDWNLDDIRGVWIALIVLLLLIGLVYGVGTGYRYWKEYRSWHTTDENENLLAYYHLLSERLRKKDTAYAECPTYRRQLSYMEKHCKEWNWDTAHMAELLERACYSKDGLSPFECKCILLQLMDIEKKVKQWKH